MSRDEGGMEEGGMEEGDKGNGRQRRREERKKGPMEDGERACGAGSDKIIQQMILKSIIATMRDP